MEEKPFHFDGSIPFRMEAANESLTTFQLTDEMRKLIGQNPYSVNEYEK